ncbi:MAG TPA: hypothetical protein VMX55_07195 [candidate division Zixibacteria bacterium]|nr:hypothetical protein [candidate division Zixibacteria bacterium]
MSINLILRTPDIFSVGKSISERIVVLNESDYIDKTIKEVITQKAFKEVLKEQEDVAVKQAFQLLLTLIQPVGIKEIESWWEQSFETLIIQNSDKVIIDMEFNEEGLEFIDEML